MEGAAMTPPTSKPARAKALAASREYATTTARHDAFGAFAALASSWLGSKWAFLGAILIIVVWAASGRFFHFSDTWQLVINTGTTIVTFLMVFLIQNTQNRDAKAINLKLDELIYATDAAADQMLDIETLSDEELDVMHARYEQLRAECVRRQRGPSGPDKHQ
jgi:low affinity Fe/Cu permease